MILVKTSFSLQRSQLCLQDTSSASVTDDSMDATEALAVDVVESLFDRSGLAETSCTSEDFDDQVYILAHFAAY